MVMMMTYTQGWYFAPVHYIVTFNLLDCIYRFLLLLYLINVLNTSYARYIIMLYLYIFKCYYLIFYIDSGIETRCRNDSLHTGTYDRHVSGQLRACHELTKSYLHCAGWGGQDVRHGFRASGTDVIIIIFPFFVSFVFISQSYKKLFQYWF